MKIKISDHFTYKTLLRFTLPSIAMMIFTSIYGVVDGFFVSNYAGKTAFSAVNFIMPFLMMLGSVGFLVGTGGSALIAKTIGEGNGKRANRLFSMLIYVTLGFGTLLAALSYLFLPQVASLLGGEGAMLEYSILYGRIILLSLPLFILQFAFQSFMVMAEKPTLGFLVTVAAGCANMLLDWLFVGVLDYGLAGAAAATAISQALGGLIPLFYFCFPNTSLLRLTRATFDGRALLRTCTNGSSELMSSISMSVVGMLYNAQLLKYAGEDGVSAYGVLMYVGMIFLAVFIGLSIGTAPIISYHYGAGNHEEMKNVLRRCLTIIGIFSVLMLLAGELLARPLSLLFVGYDEGLLAITLRAFKIYSFHFLFCGIAIYGSSFFTALNNGLVSAVISFLRTLVFQVAAVLIFPLIWELDGLWLSNVFAEIAAATLTVTFLLTLRKRYRY